jgi:serine/threonine-protein kinase
MRVWSDQYDDDLTNIFQVQERLARAIANQLELRLGDAVASRSSVDVEALDLYFTGLDRFRQRGDHVREAIDYFERAIAIDPRYAEAYGGLAMAYAVLPGWDTASTQWAAERTRYAAQRAIDLDDRLPEPYAALCQSLALSEWKWAEAEEACNAAIRRNGSLAIAHAWLGELLGIVGRFGESRTAFDRALLLDGYSGVVHQMAGVAAVSARELPRGSALLERSVELGLESSRIFAAAAAVLQNDEARARKLLATVVPAGRLDMFLEAARNSEVRAAVAEAAAANVDRRWPNWAVENARTFAFIGDDEGTLKYLQLAFDRHEFTLASQLHWPFFDFVRGDPRFQSMVRGMGLDPDAAIRANVMQLRPND